MIAWWATIFIAGIIFLPLTRRLFANFWDRGYIFSKILGLVLITYLTWLISSIRIIPFSNNLIILIAAVSMVFNLLFLSKSRDLLTRKFLSIFTLEESLFTLGLLFWAYIKSFEPSIHGLEKFMDYGFINSILRTTYFPPRDLWLTPLSINYYYFGHLITAILIKISQVNPDIGFNLMLATLFGLTLTASFSITSNLYNLFLQKKEDYSIDTAKSVFLAGFLGAFLVTLGGNLQTIYAFFQNYVPADKPVPFWQLPLTLNLQGYWYPNATRFIPFTIHEFPIYSFVVSDLHGHVLNIPFVLLTIALLIQLYLSPSKSFFVHLSSFIVLLSLLIATSLMTNVLDGPIYLLGVFLILLFKKIRLNEPDFLMETIKTTSIVLILSVIFSLPYWLAFKPFGSGIGVLCAPTFLTDIGHLGPFLFEADHCMRSPLWMLGILWGFFYFVIFSFIFAIRKQIKNFIHLAEPDQLVLILALFATILITIPEFFYVKDIYPQHYRANTVFKFGYQAFITFGLISGYMLTRLITQRKFYLPYWLVCSILFCLVAIYPLFAINSYFGGLKTYQGLDGFNYFSNIYPSDYIAILWLRKNISGQPVILEAQGDSYTDFARVSANTGLPTVIGWPVHEWLWRGSYDEAGKRSSEVSAMYESQDLNLTKSLLKQHNVSYVFIGALERQKYTNLNEEKFQSLGKVVFKQGLTVIYKLNI